MQKSAYTILVGLFALLVAACGGKEADKTQTPADTIAAAPSVKYEILMNKQMGSITRLEVLLPGGRCSMDQLKQIGRKLAKEVHGATQLKAFYRLPMPHNVRYIWATQDILPMAEPNIQGMLNEEFADLKTKPLINKGEVLGVWTNWYVDTKTTLVVLYKEDNKHYLYVEPLSSYFKYAKKPIEVSLVKQQNGDTKITKPNDTEEYYLLEPNGDLSRCFVVSADMAKKGEQERKDNPLNTEYYMEGTTTIFPLEKIK